MAYCRLVLLLCAFVGIYAEAEVPVFLWGDLPKTSLKSNPLIITEEKEFFGIVQEELENEPFTVVFIEETLSVEDFSRRNIDGETSFPYLAANLGNSLYLPAVDGALTVLDDISESGNSDHVKLTENGLSAEIQEGGKFLFISLNDAKEGESRSELLRRHNDFMQKRFEELKAKHKNVVAVYTAQFPSWTVPELHSRVRRQAAGNGTRDIVLDGLRLYVQNLYVFDGQYKNLTTLEDSSNEYDAAIGDMNTTLKYEQSELKLRFLMSRGYWKFSSVELNGTDLYPDEDVSALMGFCYRCAQNITFTSTSTTGLNVTFINVKVQPFFDNTTNQFGDPFFCAGFFSVPIWAGLFVAFIFLFITFYGLMMMMDIRTMDRFDDPKGKTITINAAE